MSRNIVISSNNNTPDFYEIKEIGFQIWKPFSNVNMSEFASVDELKETRLKNDIATGVVDGIPLPAAELAFAVCVVPDEIEVTTDSEWQQIGYIRTRPAALMPDYNYGSGRVYGDYDLVGEGGQVLVSDFEDIENAIIPAQTLAPAVHGELSVFSLPPVFDENSHLFVLWARKNGASEMRLRGITFGLIDFS